MSEDDLDAAAERLKAKWGGAKPKSALAEADRKMVESLMGRNNTDTYARRSMGEQRPFRPAPVHVHFEWYIADAAFFSGWTIERIENGRKEQFARGYLDHELRRHIADLQAKGFTVREVKMGLEPKKGQQVSARKATLDRLGKFRI